MNATRFATEEQLLAFVAGGEQMVARVRLLLVLCVFAIPALQLAYFRTPHPEMLIGLFASRAALILAVTFVLLARVLRFERWLPYVTSISDVSLVSAPLAAFLVIDAPMVAVNSRVVWEIYLLAIAATALRPRRGVAIATTLVAIGQYLAIAAFADWHWNLHDPARAPFAYGMFSWVSQFSRLMLIGVAGLIAATIIRKIGRISHLAGTDVLTDTYNRTYFDLRIAQEVQRARRYRRALTLVLVDIDHFKRINHTLGHEIGDQALVRIAQCLKDGLRKSDVLFRHGGDELAILMPETTVAEAHHILQRIMLAMRKQSIEGHSLTFSVGIASLSTEAADPQALVKAADAHLYAAKANGRDCIMPRAA